MKQPIKLSLAIALALGSPAAWALGLGGITTKSGLNEPLVAEIAINEAAPGEAEALRANLASAEDFARVGLDLSGVTVPLSFEVVKAKDGQAVIQVSSESPVREPFLSFLVEVSWANGRLLREYTVLLDPPVVAPAVIGSQAVAEPVREPEPIAAPEALPPSPSDAEPAPEPIAETPAPGPAPIEQPAAELPAAEPPAPEPVAEVPAPTPEPTYIEPEPAAPTPVSSAPGEYGPVAAGETLWEISTATRPERDITLNQMMIAILRANPDAFSNNNVNQLKRGAVLRIPSADEARALAVADAAAEIAAQTQAWQGTRTPTLLADTGVPAPEPRSTESRPPRDDSRLELVPPRAGSGGAASGVDRPGAAGGTDTAAVRGDLERAREQLASREQEAGELRTRVQTLERLQQDNTRLVDLKDSEIAELQRRLKAMQDDIEAQKAAAAAQATAAVPMVDPTPAPIAPEPAIVEPAPVEPAVIDPAVTAAVADPAVTPPIEPGVEPNADPGMNPVTDPATDPATAIVETPADAAADPAVVDVTPVPDPEPAAAAPIQQRPATPWWQENLMLIGASAALLLGGILLLLLRGRRKAAPALASRASVAESFDGGVFGDAADRGDEERELLNHLGSDPTDLESHLALLRHYYTQGDAEKFEGAAGAMYGQVSDIDAPAWVEACAMGRELLPGNQMFELEPISNENFDFDQVEADTRQADDGFDLGKPGIEAIKSVEPEAFDFSLEEPAAPLPPARTSAPPAPADDMFRTEEFEAPQLDIDPPSVPATGGFFDGEDAVGTKLDLARAYLDMGDPEGARSMLQEVISEGSAAQKTEAQRLLNDIG